MKLHFPYRESNSSSFGRYFTIKFWLSVETSSKENFIPLLFLFDTGADVTSLPISVAKKLGVDLSKCPQESMTGYEGTSVFVYRSKIKIKLDRKVVTVPCVFTPIEHVPILLGRAGILDKFIMTLDGEKKEILFEEV